MAKLIFEGLTPEQAYELASWFEGSGEQFINEWLAEQGIESPLADVSRKGGYRVVDGEDTTLYCYTP